MRRLVRWIAGLAGIAALVKLLGARRRRGQPTPVPVAEPDPADELRRRLAEVRSGASPGPGEPTSATAPAAATEDASAPTLEERRASIHARAQEAIDAMRETDG